MPFARVDVVKMCRLFGGCEQSYRGVPFSPIGWTPFSDLRARTSRGGTSSADRRAVQRDRNTLRCACVRPPIERCIGRALVRARTAASSAWISDRESVCAARCRALGSAVGDARAQRRCERSGQRSCTAPTTARSRAPPRCHHRCIERSRQRGTTRPPSVYTTVVPTALNSVRHGRSRIALARGVIVSYTPPQGTPGGSDPVRSGRDKRFFERSNPPPKSIPRSTAYLARSFERLSPCVCARPDPPLRPSRTTAG